MPNTTEMTFTVEPSKRRTTNPITIQAIPTISRIHQELPNFLAAVARGVGARVVMRERSDRGGEATEFMLTRPPVGGNGIVNTIGELRMCCRTIGAAMLACRRAD